MLRNIVSLGAMLVLVLGLAGAESARADFVPPGNTPSACFGGELDLNAFNHGDVVNVNAPIENPFGCLEIHAKNKTNDPFDPDYAVIFDTQTDNAYSRDEDSDLLGPPWSRGNIDLDTFVGNILVVQHGSSTAGCADGTCLNVNDEDRGYPGVIAWIEFRFANPEYLFGFDLFDVEVFPKELGFVSFCEGSENCTGSNVGGEIAFFDPTGTMIDLETRDGAEFGDNSINRISSFSPDEFGMDQFGSVRFNFGGSGGLGNFIFHAPEPGTALLLGAGLFGIGALRRRP